MGKKGEGLEAFVKAKTSKGKTAHPSEEESKTSAVHSSSDNPKFNKVRLTESRGPTLKRGRIADNPTVYHPPKRKSAVPKTPKKAVPTPKPTDKQSKAIRQKIAASTEPRPDIDQAEAMKLVLSCDQLLKEFQNVARAFQSSAAGRREGPVYEAWRDLNHAQVLLYRSISLMKEGYKLDE